MERRTFVLEASWLASALLAACHGKDQPEEAQGSEEAAPEVEELIQDTTSEEPAAQQPAPEAEDDKKDEAEDNHLRIQVTINGTPFTATLEEGPTAWDMLNALPMTLHMEELHGNEKYNYTDVQFTGEETVPRVIEAGDLMVYDTVCLVLFYKTFDNPGHAYQYLGRIDDPSTLAKVCGSNSVMVDFEALA